MNKKNPFEHKITHQCILDATESTAIQKQGRGLEVAKFSKRVHESKRRERERESAWAATFNRAHTPGVMATSRQYSAMQI